MEPADPRRRADVADPVVRALSAANGAGRVAIGLGLMLAPEKALAILGFQSADLGVVLISRIAGVRDMVLGVSTLLALDDPARLRAASLANAGADAGDAVAFALALSGERRRAALRGLITAAPAAIASLWAASRLDGA